MTTGFDDNEYQKRYDDLDAMLSSIGPQEIWLSEFETEFGTGAVEAVKVRWAANEAIHGALSAEQAPEARINLTTEARRNRIPELMNQQMAIDFCEAYSIMSGQTSQRDPHISPRLAVYGIKGDARDFEPVWDQEAQRYRHAVEDPAVWAELKRLQMRGNQVFFYLNEVKKGPGRGYNGAATNEDVHQIQCFSADFDGGLPDTWHGKSGVWEDKDATPFWTPEPDIVIKTSCRTQPGGRTVQRGQALWLAHHCRKGHQKEGMASLFKSVQHRLAAYHDPEGWKNRKVKGWQHITDKGVHDLRRVHRLPGTLHLKDPANPQLVTFERIHQGGRRDLIQIIAGLPQETELEDIAEREQQSAEHEEVHHSDDVKPLVKALAYLDPSVEYGTWSEVISAIEASPMGTRAEREDVAVAWSRGDYWEGRRPTVTWIGNSPRNWKSDADVKKKYQDFGRSRLARKARGEKNLSIGSLIKWAREAGMQWTTETANDFDPYLTGEEQTTTSTKSKARPRLAIISARDLLAIEDPKPLVQGLLMERENVAVVGEMKVGKSFIALDASLSIAANLPVLKHLPVMHSGPTVYLSGEGHSGFKQRLRAWGAARGLSWADLEALPFYYNAGVPLARLDMLSKEREAAVTEAKCFIDGIRTKVGEPVLVVIDTMARAIAGLDENSSMSATAYLDMTEEIREGLGCTMLTIAHATNKGRDQKTELDFRGSSGFGAGFDTTWTARVSHGSGTVKLEARWAKEADVSQLGPWYFRIVNQTLFKRDGTMDQVQSAALEYIPAAVAAKVEVKADKKETTADEVYQALTRLGACPGRSLEWHDMDHKKVDGWPEAPAPAYGGARLNELAVQILKDRGNPEPGVMETDEVRDAIKKAVNDGGAIKMFHVQNRQGRYGGMIFAIKS